MSFFFGDLELDQDRLLLLRSGQPQQVEPRVLELLVYLIENRHRLVERDELIDELWGGRVVTDSALSRCLYQARQAIGDSSSGRRYLVTVHGRGIRFAEDVEVTEAPPAESSTDTETAAGDRSARPTRLPGGWRIAAVVAVAAAVLAALSILFLIRLPHGDPAPARLSPAATPSEASADGEPARPTLALVPFTVAGETGDDPSVEQELGLLALSLVDLLHTRLAGVPGLQLRPLATARQEATAAGSLRELATRVGASHVITGSMSPVDAGRVEAELVLFEIRPDLPARAMPLGTFALPRLLDSEDFGELFRIRDAIAQRTTRLIGSTFVFGDREPGGTGSPEAWRLYVLAYQRLSDDFCAGSRPATELLERALELDPEFGLAWEALGTAYYNRVWACGEHASLYDSAFAALDRAAAVAPDLRYPRFTRITLLIESGEVEEAYELLQPELASHPDDPLTLNAQSYALRYAGFLELSAAALDRALELDPLAFAVGTLGGSPNAYLYQGRLERFLQVVPTSEMAYHRWYRGFAEFMLERPDAAREVLEPAFRSSPSQIFGRLSHALLAVIENDPGAARAIVGEVSRQRHAMGAVDPEITLKQAQILALAGDGRGALAELDRTVRQGFFCPRCIENDASLATLHGDESWDEILSRARERHFAFARRFELNPEI